MDLAQASGRHAFGSLGIDRLLADLAVANFAHLSGLQKGRIQPARKKTARLVPKRTVRCFRSFLDSTIPF
jgi:hypothetical protein